MTEPSDDEAATSLRVGRIIPAPPDRVFEAWTNPTELKKWWGPNGVQCVFAQIDLQIGGRFKIGNELTDGSILWIEGAFEVIERPHLLIYTWTVKTKSPSLEHVTVRFAEHDRGTEVVVLHERIPSDDIREQHVLGWQDCIDSLVAYTIGVASEASA